MLTKQFAQHFAQNWIDAWNSHDLDRILAHYTEDFEFTSPNIVRVMGEPSGHLKGKPRIREYWQKGLARLPNLRFAPLNVTFGMNSIAIVYQNAFGGIAVEWFLFDEHGKVTKSIAHYDDVLR